MIHRIFPAPRQSYFLFGPRGTGKSTWVQQKYPDAFYIDLLAPDVHRRYSATPEYMKQVVSARVDVREIVIDEIQKAPVLLDVVHQMMESRPELRFVLTGSSARKLKRAGVDLLMQLYGQGRYINDAHLTLWQSAQTPEEAVALLS